MDSATVFNPAFQQRLLVEIQKCMDLASSWQDRIKEPDFVTRKDDDSPVTMADHAVQKHLQTFLAAEMPEWAFIGEENAGEWLGQALPQTPFWLCDPIDGTADYAAGGDEYAINLALIENGRAVFGLIAAPGKGEIALTAAPDKVSLIDKDGKARYLSPPLRTIPLKDATLITGHGRKKDTAAFVEMAGGEPANAIQCASALKFHYLLKGEAHVYLRVRETWEWDIAAGDAMVRAMGGVVFDKDRQTFLRYGSKDTQLKLNGIFAALGAA